MQDEIQITRYEALDVAREVLARIIDRIEDNNSDRAKDLDMALHHLNILGPVWAHEETRAQK